MLLRKIAGSPGGSIALVIVGGAGYGVYMRVLMVSKACLVGAYQRKLEEIARFPDVDLMVVVPAQWDDGSRTVKLERAHVSGYQLVTEPMALNGRYHLHVYPRLGRRLQEFAPHVVHIDEEPYNLATFHALWLTKRFGARALWFSWQNLNRRYPHPFRLIERYCLRQTDYVIAGSQGAADVWRAKGYRGPLEVIPQFGVDPQLFSPAAGQGHGGSEFAIGYVGRLVPEKGVGLLLDAVAELEGDWRLTILGTGSERERLMARVHELRIAGRVHFREPLRSVEMPRFYRQLDVLVLPSRSRPNWIEQFGRVLIEAMACGVPVVGSDCGEIPHVIGPAGLVFPEGDSAALRARLDRLQKDAALRADLARRGRARVIERYTQRRVADQTVAVYRETLALE